MALTPTGSAFATTTPFSWGYNGRGELTTANRPGSPAFERAYQYDGIGNRLFSETSGAQISDPAGPNTTTYIPNALNQYSSITLNSPPSTLNPSHDDDGNLTSGPVPGANGLLPGVPVPANASLTWDAENRLVKAVVNGTTVHYDYDHQSRLISRGVGVSPATFTRYLYDGWNRIAEYESNGSGHTHKSTYLWGMDLSGTMQGAGGVGGLLSMTLNSQPSPLNYYPTYDGNGNVSEYVDDNGDNVAHFEYDPFGNLTVDSENNAGNFPYRFSTKPQDTVTGLYYYGYRWHDSMMGRWPSRDPIDEGGGINLYGFLGNASTSSIDLFGLAKNDFYSYIIAGHGWHTVGSQGVSQGSVEQLMTQYQNEKTFDKERDRVSAVSCFNGDINRRFARSIKSSNDQYNDTKIIDFTEIDDPKTKTKKKLWNPEEPGFLWFRSPRRLPNVTPSGVDNKHWAFDGSYEAYSLAEQKFVDAETQAEKDLVEFMKNDPKLKVCSITVKFVCDSYIDIGMDVLDFEDRRIYPPNGTNLCGYSNTYRFKKSGSKWDKPKLKLTQNQQ